MNNHRIRCAVAAGLLAFAMAPLQISAAPLSSSQTTLLKSGTSAYFKSLSSGNLDALTAQTTPDFKITRNGKAISAENLSGMIQAAKLNLGSSSGSMRIDSASTAAGVITEIVTLKGEAETFNSDNTQGVSGMVQHRLTWVKGASGKWLLSHDEILSASRG